MNIVVIGCTFNEAAAACQNTVSKVTKEGHCIYFLIASDHLGVNKKEQQYHHLQLLKHSIAEEFFLKGFDFSAITQANADTINSCIRRIKPSMVIIPHLKSSNSHRRILARASLIACRGIGSILMYDPDLRNPVITPINLLASRVGSSLIVGKNSSARMHAKEDYGKPNRIANNDSDTHMNSPETAINLKYQYQSSVAKPERERITQEQGSQSIRSNGTVLEIFESHRILMLEDDGIF